MGSSAMLERLHSCFDEELDVGDGLWPRAELEQMNDRFVAAVELAFRSGGESRAAASSTVKIGRNGSRLLAEDMAIGAAWQWLREKMDANVDISFVEVVAFVNARCPGVDRVRIREAFKQRLRQAVIGGLWA